MSSRAPPFSGASFGIAASFPSRNRCRPSPCDRLSRPRSTTAAPPRPGPFSGRCAYPRTAEPDARRREPGRGGSRVHCRSLDEGGARLCPAASPRLRRRPSPWPPRLGKKTQPGSSPPRQNGRDDRARPRSARFEPVSPIKDVTTPVPRVLLFISLAGPAPSGSTDTSRLCQGCSRPPRHHPDQAALSYDRPAATRRRRRSLTSTRTTAPRCAKWRSLAAQP